MADINASVEEIKACLLYTSSNQNTSGTVAIVKY